MLHDPRRPVPLRVQAGVPEGMSMRQRERNDSRNCAEDSYKSENSHAFSASEESTIARWLCRAM
jgi:hypothetical protein